MMQLGLPTHLIARPGTFDDIPLIAALTSESETLDAGEPLVTLEDIHSDWHRPGFSPAVDSLLVFDSDRMAACAEVPGWRASASVHPDYRGLGIGTALLKWTERRGLARTPSNLEARVGQTIPESHRAAADLFLRHGYELRHTSWVLRLPEDRSIERLPLPGNIEIRPFRPAQETEAVFRVIEDAFNEWPDRQPTSFETWRAEVLERRDFEPSLLLVAAAQGEIVGAAFGIPYPNEGWVEHLAVRADYRGRGIAKALLRAAFDEFRSRGLPAVGLSTDTRTGALDLYLQIGMAVRATWVHYSKLLRLAGTL
jgi:GNAT superfamily N-acetyltransferase